MKTLRRILVALLLAAATAAFAQQPLPTDDPLLTALKEELQRSQEKLQLPGQSKPYFIQYVVNDDDSYGYESMLGATVGRVHTRNRLVTVFVRIGDYKEDNDMGYGLGLYEIVPSDNDILAVRRALWLATDAAYKSALQMATAKESLLKQYEKASDEDVASFSKEAPAQYFEPRATLPADMAPYERALDAATALYRTDPEIQGLSGSVRFTVNNFYVINTEGTAMRMAQGGDSISINADTQATDGMRLRRNFSREARTPAGLPNPAELKAKTAELLATLRALRTAPVVTEEYRGPVLFSNDAAGTVVESLLAKNLIGRRPQPGKSGRVVGTYAESLHARILPETVKIVDDPTLDAFSGQALAGHYPYDDEGVKARPVTLVDKGVLQNYVMSRRPIRGFGNSNGHGRNLGAAIDPSPANFIFTTSAPTPAAEMKQKLLALCKERELDYCYYVATMAGVDNPRLLYRVYTKDGHEELVRGGALDELDARSMRTDLVAIGDDPFVTSNPASLPTSYVAPSLLFGELVVKHSSEANDKLPDYPAPAAQ